MSKYDPLREHLFTSNTPRGTMTFQQIEALVGPLPASARDHQAWWANDSGPSHVQSRAWMNAGYRVHASDLTAHTVTFTRA